MIILLSTEITSCTSTSAHAYQSSVNNTKNYYIANNGSDTNPGALEKPFKSIAKAQKSASAGDIVYIRGGIYKNFTIAGSNEKYNYINEITKSGITYNDVTFESIKVTGVPVGKQKQSECFKIEGNAAFKQVTCSDNQAIGFYFTGHAKGSCIRCDSYNNIGVKGISIGNIDGFGAHGDGVAFKECRAWNNSDDGFDCNNIFFFAGMFCYDN